MSEENIYSPPKSEISSNTDVGGFSWINKERNLIICLIIICVVSYALGFFQAERAGKSLTIMSPVFLGGLFPISAILSALIIKFLGNSDKVTIYYAISFKVCWSMGWRVLVSSVMSMLLMAIMLLAFKFRADSQPILFFALYWIVILPFSTWILFSNNRKRDVAMLFKVFRGY